MEMKIQDGFKNERAIVTPYSIRELLSKNPNTKAHYITHIGFYPNAKNHYRDRVEGAPQHIIIYCSKGKGWVKIKEKEFQLKENDTIIIPADTEHAYGADELNPWSIYWIHFTGESKIFSDVYARKISIDNAEASRISDRLKLFDEMYKNLEMGYSTDNLEYANICLIHFLASLKYIRQFRTLNYYHEDDLIQNCIAFMREKIETKLTLADIAQHVGFSTNHVNVVFKESTSYSILEYFNQLKIQRACSLLQFSDKSIKEIAFALNFYDQYHFSKAFKKQMEITPKEYRRKYNELKLE